MFKLFNPELKKIIKKHSKFISGSKNTINFIKKKKIKIGVNTGYSEEILKVILPELKKNKDLYPMYHIVLLSQKLEDPLQK